MAGLAAAPMPDPTRRRLLAAYHVSGAIRKPDPTDKAVTGGAFIVVPLTLVATVLTGLCLSLREIVPRWVLLDHSSPEVLRCELRRTLLLGSFVS